MLNLIFILVLILILFFSVKAKIVLKKKRSTYSNVPEDVKKSPFSEAISELVATAGGIYLSLLLLTTFLEIDVPEKVEFISIQFDLLAFIALLLTILQPFVLNIFSKN